MGKDSVLYVISVLAPDRRGIIADVSDAIYRLGGNLEATSQTIMQGWFTMLLSVRFPASVNRARLERALGRIGDVDVLVRKAAEEMPSAAFAGEPYVVVCVGEDKPGIVRGLSLCCADNGVNIEDVWNEVREGRFLTVLRVTLPENLESERFRKALKQVAGTLGVTFSLQHHDIFTATNSLEVHTQRRQCGIV